MPSLRSVTGKSLDIVGRRLIELDCCGHSICVNFYVCTDIPFPLVSVARLLLQGFCTVLGRDHMCVLTPESKTVPVTRSGALLYITPTVIPYDEAEHIDNRGLQCALSNLKLNQSVAQLKSFPSAELGPY